MVKSIHKSFPEDGVDVHISAEDALAHGINPGDPAVVEATVRPHTVEEWIAEGESTVETKDEGADEGPTRISWRTTGFESIAVKAESIAAKVEPAARVEGHTRITWKSAGTPSEALAVAPVGAEPVGEEPVGAGAGGDHTRIRWRSALVG